MPQSPRLTSLALAARSALWTCLMPGLVTVYLPWRFFHAWRSGLAWGSPPVLLGLALVAAGAGLLAACIWEFAHFGRGTLAPVDAPKALVVQGLYRFVRNPMYVGVVTLLAGELALWPSVGLLVYIAAGAAWIHGFVVLYEEPALRRRFGASYARYASSVHRWVPRPPRRESP